METADGPGHGSGVQSRLLQSRLYAHAPVQAYGGIFLRGAHIGKAPASPADHEGCQVSGRMKIVMIDAGDALHLLARHHQGDSAGADRFHDLRL